MHADLVSSWGSVMKSPFSGTYTGIYHSSFPTRLAKTFFSGLMVGRHPNSARSNFFPVCLFVKIRHHNIDLCLFRQVNVRSEFNLSIFNGP